MLKDIGINKKTEKFYFFPKNFILHDIFERPIIPKIIFQNNFFAVVYKPNSMPTAPLKLNEEHTLLSWFLKRTPEAINVTGRKQIEAGLLHRLDTPTSGLILIAKTQSAYNFFIKKQNKNLIKKTYLAIVYIQNNKTSDDIINQYKLPKIISSQFKPFGPKQKMVTPIFKNDKKFSTSLPIYSTKIINLKKINNKNLLVTCEIYKGYRHQIRSHLASQGLPIKNDFLYNPNHKNDSLKNNNNYNLQLHAVKINIL